MNRKLTYTASLALLIGPGLVMAMEDAVPKYSNPFGAGSELLRGEDGNATFNFALAAQPRGLFGLLDTRQTTCRTGYHACSINDGCCPIGDSCVADGCCDGAMQQCGSSHCYDPATQVCCSDGSHCPTGYDCFSGGCCPSGTQPCGSDKCYDPATEICCEGGSCPQADSCCTNECCRSIAYCAADGYCSLCPAETRTLTRTTSTTYTSTVTRTTTVVEEPEEELPGFTCVPMTATNDAGAVLELGDDCALDLSLPPDATGSGTATAAAGAAATLTSVAKRGGPAAAAAAAAELPPAALLPRQTACTPYTTVSRTLTTTLAATVTTTTTRTVTVDPSDLDFSCAEMTVTNAAGDELSLNDSCELEFTPAEPTGSGSSSSDTTGTGESSSAATSPGSDAASVRGDAGSSWQILVAVVTTIILPLFL